MRKILVLFFSILTPTLAFAGDCTELNGVWQATNQGNSTEYIYLKVIFEPLRRSLEIDYFYDANESIRSFSEAYIADGLTHVGDIDYTGNSYQASCVGGAISIVRNFQELRMPLGTKLSATDHRLSLSSDNGGESPDVTEIFVPGHL